MRFSVWLVSGARGCETFASLSIPPLTSMAVCPSCEHASLFLFLCVCFSRYPRSRCAVLAYMRECACVGRTVADLVPLTACARVRSYVCLCLCLSAYFVIELYHALHGSRSQGLICPREEERAAVHLYSCSRVFFVHLIVCPHVHCPSISDCFHLAGTQIWLSLERRSASSAQTVDAFTPAERRGSRRGDADRQFSTSRFPAAGRVRI